MNRLIGAFGVPGVSGVSARGFMTRQRRSGSPRVYVPIGAFAVFVGLLVPAPGAVADPVANRQLSANTVAACERAPFGASCVQSALADVNSARASEAIGPMTLPTDFASLTVPEQLLVLSNLERVDRGLVSIGGLSSGLNANAQQGASANTDPTPSPLYGNSWSANWEGGYASAVEADFIWMYDDGPGSGNLDCKSFGDPGCWGHRNDILFPFSTPLVMGAGATDSAPDGPSLTELFVGGDTQANAGEQDAPIPPTWPSISQTLPIGLSSLAVSLSGQASAHLAMSASGEDMDVMASITAGSDEWSVSPIECILRAGSTCQMTVRIASARSSVPGALWL